MKKLLVLLTLLAAFASFGCGSDEPAADAPAKAPQAATKQENKISDKQKSSNDSYNKSLDKIKAKYKDGEPKIGQTKPGDTIHHFSK